MPPSNKEQEIIDEMSADSLFLTYKQFTKKWVKRMKYEKKQTKIMSEIIYKMREIERKEIINFWLSMNPSAKVIIAKKQITIKIPLASDTKLLEKYIKIVNTLTP